MNKRTLVILNARYPYDKSEDFLSNEVDYVQGFDEIIIFPVLVYGSKSDRDIIYKVPKNRISFYNSDSSYHFKSKRFNLYRRVLFQRYFYEELFCLLKTKRLNYVNLKCLLSFLMISYNAFEGLWAKIKDTICNDNVVVYSYWMHCDAMVAILLGEKIRKVSNLEKVLTRCHRFDLYEYAENGYIPMRKYLMSNLDEIYSISEDGLIYLHDTYNVDEEKLYLSRLGTNDLGINIHPKSDVLRLVSCSWMRPIKRVSSIVRAISNLPFQVEWTHYGDGEEYNEIVRLISEIDNPLVSCRLMGACRNEKVLEDYKTEIYDVFINVSANEGVPVSIMEALSFGKIVIATKVGGTSEIIDDSVNGFLLEKDFATEDLVSAINRIACLSNDEFENMCYQSRKIWEERCNAVDNYKSFYCKLQQNN